MGANITDVMTPGNWIKRTRRVSHEQNYKL